MGARQISTRILWCGKYCISLNGQCHSPTRRAIAQIHFLPVLRARFDGRRRDAPADRTYFCPRSQSVCFCMPPNDAALVRIWSAPIAQAKSNKVMCLSVPLCSLQQPIQRKYLFGLHCWSKTQQSGSVYLVQCNNRQRVLSI